MVILVILFALAVSLGFMRYQHREVMRMLSVIRDHQMMPVPVVAPPEAPVAAEPQPSPPPDPQPEPTPAPVHVVRDIIHSPAFRADLHASGREFLRQRLAARAAKRP